MSESSNAEDGPSAAPAASAAASRSRFSITKGSGGGKKNDRRLLIDTDDGSAAYGSVPDAAGGRGGGQPQRHPGKDSYCFASFPLVMASSNSHFLLLCLLDSIFRVVYIFKLLL
jgi:hypothetical protein